MLGLGYVHVEEKWHWVLWVLVWTMFSSNNKCVFKSSANAMSHIGLSVHLSEHVYFLAWKNGRNWGVVSCAIQTLRSGFYLFLPAAASGSFHGGVISVTRPLAGCDRTFQLCGEEVDFTEGLGHLQSGERVVSRGSRRFLFHHPGNKLLTLCNRRGSVGKRQRRFCCMNSVGPFCRIMLLPPGFLPDDHRVVDVLVPQVLLGQYGALNSFIIVTFVPGLWISLLILWRCGRLCLGREKLIGGVGVGGMKVIGRSTLD